MPFIPCLQTYSSFYWTLSVFLWCVCSKLFNNQNDLERHLCICSGDISFSCEVCIKSFGQRDALKRHQSIHSGDHLFFFSVSNKSFRVGRVVIWSDICRYIKEPVHFHVACVISHSLGGMILRDNTDSRERSFSCDVCNRSFSWRCDMKKNQCMHSTQRPFLIMCVINCSFSEWSEEPLACIQLAIKDDGISILCPLLVFSRRKLNVSF
jgi:hypothetical protein